MVQAIAEKEGVSRPKTGTAKQGAQIGLMGASLGTGNRGVSALSASVIGLLEEALPGCKVSLVIGNRSSEPYTLRSGTTTQSISVMNYRMSARTWKSNHMIWILFAAFVYKFLPLPPLRRWFLKVTPWLRFVVEADCVFDIRGGDSFSDIYGMKNYISGSLPIFAVLLARGNIGLLPQTYGPYKSPLARLIARYILHRANPIISRDSESMGTVEGLIGKTDRLLFCPDVAFSLKFREPDRLNIEPPINGVARANLIGINVNGLMFNGGYSRANMFGLKLDYPDFLVRLAKALLENPNNHLLLVPHTFAPPHSVESDPEGCRKIRQSLPAELQARVHMVEGEYDQGEIKWVIGRCDFFVGSRMHACIAALSQGIPAVGVAYSKKFIGVFQTVGVDNAIIDGRDMDAEGAVARAMELYRERETFRLRLAASVNQAQATVRSVFKEAVSKGGRR